MTFKRTKISRYFTLRERKKLNLSELTPQAAVMILKDVVVKLQCTKTE